MIDQRIINLGMYHPTITTLLALHSKGDIGENEALTQIILNLVEYNNNQTSQIISLQRGKGLQSYLSVPIVENWLKTLPLRKPIDLSLEDIRDSPEVENFRETDSHICFVCGYVSVSIEKSILRVEDQIVSRIQAGFTPEPKSLKVENPTQECLDAIAEKKANFDDW